MNANSRITQYMCTKNVIRFSSWSIQLWLWLCWFNCLSTNTKSLREIHHFRLIFEWSLGVVNRLRHQLQLLLRYYFEFCQWNVVHVRWLRWLRSILVKPFCSLAVFCCWWNRNNNCELLFMRTNMCFRCERGEWRWHRVITDLCEFATFVENKQSFVGVHVHLLHIIFMKSDWFERFCSRGMRTQELLYTVVYHNGTMAKRKRLERIITNRICCVRNQLDDDDNNE